MPCVPHVVAANFSCLFTRSQTGMKSSNKESHFGWRMNTRLSDARASNRGSSILWPTSQLGPVVSAIHGGVLISVDFSILYGSRGVPIAETAGVLHVNLLRPNLGVFSVQTTRIPFP